MGARAASGAALLGARGALIQVLGIAANLALASMLVPRDFGIVALGTVLVVVGTYAAEGGFGAALIRRDHPPDTEELRAVLGLQLLVGLALAAAAAAIATGFGRDGAIVAVMAAALPIAALRSPGVIMLERRLRYGVIARADVGEALVYYAWAVGTVGLGFGVWGLATAVVVRSAAGSAIVLAAGPVGPLLPRLAWRTVRPLLGIGLRYQALGVAQIGRAQAVNVAIAAVAGMATLGIWNLAWRVLQIPAMLLSNVGRVVFPALSRLLGGGRDARLVLERAVGLLGTLTAFVVVGVVTLAVGLPTVVGEDWGDVPAVILWSGVALVAGSPLNIAAGGYLLAAGEPGRVVTATLVSAAVWLAVTIALVSELGAVAGGIGWVASALSSAALLTRHVSARTGARLVRGPSRPAAFGLVAVAGGWLVAHAVDDPLLGAVAGLGAGELLLLATLAAFSRPALEDLVAVVLRGVKGLRAAPLDISTR